MDYDDARQLIYRRSGGLCEICGSASASDFSHRQSRAVGDDCPCQGLALCRNCHADRVHAQPKTAMMYGWIVSRHKPAGARFEPAWLPVRNGWFRLDCVGGVHEVRPPD